MKTWKICAYICVLLLLNNSVAWSQQTDTVRTERVRGIQFAPHNDDTGRKAPLLAGFSVGTDVCGAVMATVTPWGQYEGMLRLNLRGRYFPCIELGLGMSDCTGESSRIHYQTRSLYARLGCDYNFVNDWHSGNRILAGLRYGFSPYKFDVSGPNLVDAVYGESIPFSYEGMRSTAHWLELSGGAEARVWKFFHLGWTLRYKFRISESRSAIGRGWYVPGYGRGGGHALGGSFYIMIDI